MNPAKGLESIENLIQRGELDRAETQCEELFRHAGVLPGEAYHLRGIVALRKGDAGAAVHWFGKAAVEGVNDPRCLSNLGEAYRRIGNYVEARRMLEKSMQADNTIPATHFNLAKVYRSMGEARLAEHFFRNVLILDPNKARAHFELAELYRSEGHFTEADLEYRTAITLASSTGRVLTTDETEWLSTWMTNCGTLLRERGRTEEALEFLGAALNLSDTNILARYERGRCLFELCSEFEARREFSALETPAGRPGGLNKKVVIGRIVTAQDCCAKHGTRYVELSKPQWLPVLEPKAIPPIELPSSMVGVPVAPRLYIATIDDATIIPSPHAVLAGNNDLILDGVVNLPYQYPQTSPHILHVADDLRIAMHVPGKVAPFEKEATYLGGASDHFGGLYECLGRMWAVEQEPHASSGPYILGAWAASALQPILHKFGIGEHQVRLLDAHEGLRVGELTVPSLPLIGPWIAPVVLQYIRRKLSGSSVVRGRKIFITDGLRGRATLRNTSELTAILRRAGFEIVSCREMALADLINAIQESGVIVTSDADCLAYAAAAPQGSRLAFVVPEGAVDLRLQFVAHPLGLELTYLMATPDYSSSELLANCEMTLEPSVLHRFLEAIESR